MKNQYTFVRQRGLYFNELDTSVIYEHAPGRTVTEADTTLFSTMTMNPASIHLDAHASDQNEFGQRLVNSMFTLSTLVGLSVKNDTVHNNCQSWFYRNRLSGSCIRGRHSLRFDSGDR